MSHHDPEQPKLDPQEARLVARLRAEFAPEPMTPARRAAFDETLRARIARPRGPLLVPGFAAGLAAATLVALLLFFAPPPALEAPPAPGATAEEALFAALLDADLALADDEIDADEFDDLELRDLPPSYAAVASLLLPR